VSILCKELSSGDVCQAWQILDMQPHPQEADQTIILGSDNYELHASERWMKEFNPTLGHYLVAHPIRGRRIVAPDIFSSEYEIAE